jgi:hypothetical protein
MGNMLHIVHKTVGGFTREDRDDSHIVGVYTDEDVAKKVAIASHAQVASIELDHIPPGYRSFAKELGMKFPDQP